MKGRTKASSANQVALLEVTPRTAKVLVATTNPLQIQRVNASTLPDQTDDPLTALRVLLEAQPLGTRQVGILFGREVFSLQTLELPSVDPKEIASMLELQLGKLTPYPRSEILFASSSVGSFREGYTTVLLAISRKILIGQVLAFCKTKGLVPQWVGVSTEGLEAWWTTLVKGTPPMPAGGLTAIVDVDVASTDCAILSADRRLLFTHSIPIGHEQLLTSESAKLRWMGELVRLPRILLHEEVKGQIGHGVLTGMTEGFETIVEQLTNQWGVEVELKDALTPLAPAEVRTRAKTTRVSFTALVGALVSGQPPRIDLMPQETRVSQALHVRSKHLARVVVNLSTVLLLALLLYAERFVLLQHYLTQLRTRLAPLEQTSQQVHQRQDRMRQVRQWLDPSRSALAVLQAVASAADSAVTITQVSFKEGEPVKIRGTASTSQAPYQLVERLKRQKIIIPGPACFAEVRVTGTRGAEFDISCELAGASS